jgi:predicted amidohydrolase
MENLKVTIIQPDIIWEKPLENLANYANLIASAGNTDLVILPEMFTTGFSMESEKLKETMEGCSVRWMKATANEKNVVVIGSLIIEEKGEIFNRAVCTFPDGSVFSYDKRHLFAMGQEHLHYAAGRQKLIIEYKGWKICPLICYDLRFPVWSRNTENYDLLIYVANWPAARSHVWKSLLVARAIENQSYCVGVNRSGIDGYGISYLGASALIDAKGTATFLGEQPKIKTFEVDYNELHNFRKAFPVLNDRDKFSITDIDT